MQRWSCEAPARLVPWILLGAATVATGCGRIGFSALADGALGDGLLGDGVATATCPAFAFFCDGFETGDASHWSANQQIGPNGSLVVQSTTVHTGNYALRGSMPNGSMAGLEADVGEAFASISTGMLAVREWVYQPQPLINYDAVLLLYNQSNNDYVGVGGNNSGVWTATENSSAGLLDHISTTAVSENQWLCIELDYAFMPGGSASTINLYIDDVSVLSSAVINPTPAFNLVQVGVARTSSGGSTTIADDVAMATQHIGCM
jgi:hypothetical protein